MTTTAVVKHFNVFAQVRNGFAMRAIPRAGYPLVLQAVEEVLRGRVVPAIPFAAHRAAHRLEGQLALESVAGIYSDEMESVGRFVECHAISMHGPGSLLPQIRHTPCAETCFQMQNNAPHRETEYVVFTGTYGGAEEDRTPDLRIANATLSQLSYRPNEAAILARGAGV